MRDIIIFVLQTIAVLWIYFIIDYKRPYESKLQNWSFKEKIILFLYVFIIVTLFKF